MATARSGCVTLLLGGARSGKSRHAQQLAARSERVAFIATATACDEEMRGKIARHQADRPASWKTYEVPRDLEATIQALAGRYEAVVIDCLTLWTANLLHHYHLDPNPILERADFLCGVLREAETKFFVVSNEVGDSVVPEYESGRIFRDVLGELNQRVARVADQVILMVAGYPLVVKPNAEVRRQWRTM
jgi:adenosylcobinamide kinase/adenosylcobinamide-phosphate guanylyltransferase